MKKYLMMLPVCGLLLTAGCLFIVKNDDNKQEKPAKEVSDVKEISYDVPLFNTGMSVEELEQRLGHAETKLGIQAKRIHELEQVLAEERRVSAIERGEK